MRFEGDSRAWGWHGRVRYKGSEYRGIEANAKNWHSAGACRVLITEKKLDEQKLRNRTEGWENLLKKRYYLP